MASALSREGTAHHVRLHGTQWLAPAWLPSHAVGLTVRMQQAVLAWSRSKLRLGSQEREAPGGAWGRQRGSVCASGGGPALLSQLAAPETRVPCSLSLRLLFLDTMSAKLSPFNHWGPTCLRNSPLLLSHPQPETSGFLRRVGRCFSSSLLPLGPTSRGRLSHGPFKSFSTLRHLLNWMEIAFDMCRWWLGTQAEGTDEAELILIHRDRDQRGHVGRNRPRWPLWREGRQNGF